MASIWSNAASAVGASPLTGMETAPSPGGGRTAKFQSVLQSMGKAQGATQLKSPSAGQATVQPNSRSGSAAALSGNRPTNAASTATGSDTGSTISSNDFLTLLVTEMQNQDPTADTDPNEYINQLVQINSLEQLISINQNLAAVLGTAASQSASTSGIQAAPAQAASLQSPAPTVSGLSAAGPKVAPTAAGGNLSLPRPSAASHGVAHALDGHPHVGQMGHAIRDIPTRSLQR